MKIQDAHKVLSKLSAVLIAFFVGASVALILSALLFTDLGSQAVAGTWSELGTETLALGLRLILLFVLAAVGGVVAAVVSLCMHPTVTLRASHIFLGLFVLAFGTIWILSPNLWCRFIFGPVAVIAALFVLWTAVFGRRSQVEEL